jgi:hypothetical protein
LARTYRPDELPAGTYTVVAHACGAGNICGKGAPAKFSVELR